MTDRTHGMLHLGQPHDRSDDRFPPIWSIVARHARRVGVFGSMHSSPMPANAAEAYDFFVPDYFATDSSVHPSRLEPFQAFNLSMTRQSARNVSRKLPVAQLPAVATTMLREGLRPKTLAGLGTQLVREVCDKTHRIRRRNRQAEVMADVYLRLLEQKRPHFSTFYTNNVAAAMHRYWGALFPDDAPSLPGSWKQRYRDEVIVAMDSVDDILGRLMTLTDANPEYVLVVASSLGQAAIPTEPVERFLTITELSRFLETMELSSSDWEYCPAMVPCVGVRVVDAARAKLRGSLDTLSIGQSRMKRDPRPLAPMTYNETEDGYFSIFIQVDGYAGSDTIMVREREVSLGDAGLGFMVHEDGVNCTAQHIPEGSLFAYGSTVHPDSSRRDVSTVDVAPTLLHGLEVETPSHMRGGVLEL